MTTDVVAVKGDVQCPGAGGDSGSKRCEGCVQPAGEFDSAVGDPEKKDGLPVAMALGNGLGETLNRSPDLFRADGLVFGHEARLWRSDVTR